MKRREAVSVREIIDMAMRQTGQSDVIDGHRICAAWSDVVGPGVTRMTMRRYVDRGVLHVYLTSSVMKQELGFARQELVNNLNRAVGRDVITDIRFH